MLLFRSAFIAGFIFWRMEKFIDLINSWKKGEYFADQCALALSKQLKHYNCQTIAELADLGKQGKIETDYEIHNWDKLAWSPQQLSKRYVVPLGSTCFDVNWDYPKRKSKKFDFRVVHLFAVPPTDDDPNLYSIHCQLPSNDNGVLEGVHKVKRLIDLNWLTGMGNGVKKFSLGETDICNGVHARVEYMLTNVLKVLEPFQHAKRQKT